MLPILYFDCLWICIVCNNDDDGCESKGSLVVAFIVKMVNNVRRVEDGEITFVDEFNAFLQNQYTHSLSVTY